MIRAIPFSLALMFGVIASPVAQNAQKEIKPTMIDIVYGAEPCPLPVVLVTVTPKEVTAPAPKVEARVKVKKKKPTFTAKQKKKIATAIPAKHKDKKTDHHKSHVPDHHKSIPQNNPTSHGPLHLTSPPACG